MDKGERTRDAGSKDKAPGVMIQDSHLPGDLESLRLVHIADAHQVELLRIDLEEASNALENSRYDFLDALTENAPTFDEHGNPPIIAFVKTYGAKTYHYAAVGVHSYPDLDEMSFYTTGSKSGDGVRTWEEMVKFIGNFAPTIRLLSGTFPPKEGLSSNGASG